MGLGAGIDNFNDNLVYTTLGEIKSLDVDGNAVFVRIDPAGLAGGTLTLTIDGSHSTDTLSLPEESFTSSPGVDPNVYVFDNFVQYQVTSEVETTEVYDLAQLSGGTNGAPLVITFAESFVNGPYSDPIAAVNLLLQNLTFSSQDAGTPRDIKVEFIKDSTTLEVATVTVNKVLGTAPSAVELLGDLVSEDTATVSDVNIGVLMTDDVDLGDSHAYSIFGGADADKFKIGGVNGDTLQFKAGTSLDYELQKTYKVIVRSEDSAHLTHDQELTVNIGDVNDVAPEMSHNTGTERTPTGEIIISSSMLEYIDTENAAPENVQYTLETPPDNGSLFLNDSFLDETDTFTQADIAAGNVTYVGYGTPGADSFQFSVKDPGGATLGLSTFNLTAPLPSNGGPPSPNDGPTDIVLTDPVAIDENTSTELGPLKVGTLYSPDLDIDDSAPYSIVEGIADSNKFQIGGVNGNELLFKEGVVLDFEAHPEYFVTVQSNYAEDQPHSTILKVTIGDVDEAPEMSHNTGTERTQTGPIIIGTSMLEYIDPEHAAPGDIEYTLETPPAHGALYLHSDRLDGTDSFTQADIAAGDVTYVGDDAPGADSFQFSVRDPGGLTLGLSTFNLTAPLLPNTPPTGVTLSNDHVAENSQTGDPIDIGILSSVDADDSGNHIYTIVDGPDSAMFLVDDSTNTLQFTGDAILDHEGKSSYTIQVTSADSGGLTSAPQSLIIAIDDANDAPILIKNEGASLVTGQTITIDESILQVTDQDAGAVLTYTLQSTTQFGVLRLDGVPLNTSSQFTQDDVNEGKLTYDGGGTANLDSFAFTVGDGADGGVSTTTFNLTIAAAPAAPDNITLSNNHVVENTQTGNPINIGTLHADDVNGDINLNYDIVDGPDSAMFLVDDSTNTLQFTGDAILDHEGKSSYTIQVTSADSGGLTSAPQSLTVTIDDANDAPVLVETKGASLVVGGTITIDASMLLATDQDGDATLTYTIVNEADSGVLMRDGVTLHVSATFTQADVNDGKLTYVGGNSPGSDGFEFTVVDGHGGSDEGAISLTITAPPTDIMLTTGTPLGENTSMASGPVLIGTLSTVDPDDMTGHTYDFVNDEDRAIFEIVDNELRFKQGTSLNFEVKPEYVVAIRSTDDDQQSVVKTVTFDIVDVNEAPTVSGTATATVQAGKSVTITEAMLKLTDPDIDQDYISTNFRLVDGPEHGTLKRDGYPLGTEDTFSRADINSGKLIYEGGDTSGTFDFKFAVVGYQNDVHSFGLTVTAPPAPPVTPPATGVDVTTPTTGGEAQGTAYDDTLTGQDGRDTFVAGGGEDTIEGGANTDAVVLKGDRASYTITQTADGFLITSPDGTVHLTNVEVIQAADGIIELASMANTAHNVEAGLQSILRSDASIDPAIIEQIQNGSQTLYGYFETILDQAKSTTVASLVVSDILGGATPTSEHLDELVAFTHNQMASYTELGVADPALGSFEALGRGFAETAGFQAKYGADAEDAFITEAYHDVFGRDVTQAQMEHFQEQIEFFETIYGAAGISDEQGALLAKGAVVGQMIGVAVLNETAQHDYFGNASSFLLDAADGIGSYEKPLNTVQHWDLAA